MGSQAQAHTPVPDAGDAMPSYYEIVETAVRELLVERKVIGAGEIRQMLELMDARTPALGSKIVARAWVDAELRARLIANGRATLEELGIDFFKDTQLIVLENTDKVLNLIVCTLCSCYPREVLRLPPDCPKQRVIMGLVSKILVHCRDRGCPSHLIPIRLPDSTLEESAKRRLGTPPPWHEIFVACPDCGRICVFRPSDCEWNQIPREMQRSDLSGIPNFFTSIHTLAVPRTALGIKCFRHRELIRYSA